MLAVTLLAVPIALWAGFVYLGREQLGAVGLGLATLRTVGATALLLLLVNPDWYGRRAGGAPVVLLDGSLSMGVPGGRWSHALDTALALSGEAGTIIRFGADVAPFDTLQPSAPTTRLKPALYAARARGGPIHVVSDGEIEDIAAIAPDVLRDITFVTLPRDTVPNAALLNVRVQDRVQQADSLDVLITIGTWGNGLAQSANIEVVVEDRVLATRSVDLPPGPGVGRRRVQLPARLLPPGVHVVHFNLAATGDAIPGDDRRARIVTVTEQPAITVVADPIDWEGRFLAAELSAVALTAVRSFARVGDTSWIDMSTLDLVPAEVVRNTASEASMLVVRGNNSLGLNVDEGIQAVWHWPAGLDTAFGFLGGDWYPSGEVPSSPLTAGLGLVDWASLAPLTGVTAVRPDSYEWIGLSVRLGRRGAERPVLLGREQGGVRQLITTGSGIWRWGFRGGAAREAYRTLLAVGTDWMLESGIHRNTATLTAGPVVANGGAIRFRWLADPIPDSVSLVFMSRGSGATDNATLWFDAGRIAVHNLPPGSYEWRTTGGTASGVLVVEEYSEELHPRTVFAGNDGGGLGTTLVERFARENWWLFVIVVVALATEWGWRYRKGLP